MTFVSRMTACQPALRLHRKPGLAQPVEQMVPVVGVPVGVAFCEEAHPARRGSGADPGQRLRRYGDEGGRGGLGILAVADLSVACGQPGLDSLSFAPHGPERGNGCFVISCRVEGEAPDESLMTQGVDANRFVDLSDGAFRLTHVDAAKGTAHHRIGVVWIER